MTIENISIWICDRCGKEERLDYNKQPRDWLAVVFVNPPKKSLDHEKRLHLCGDCDSEFAKFLFPVLHREENTQPSTLE